MTLINIMRHGNSYSLNKLKSDTVINIANSLYISSGKYWYFASIKSLSYEISADCNLYIYSSCLS